MSSETTWSVYGNPSKRNVPEWSVQAIGSIVMAARHRTYPLFGVQFHPESVLTPQGGKLIENVLREAFGEMAP